MIGGKLYLEFVRQVIKPFVVVVTVTELVPDTFENRKYNKLVFYILNRAECLSGRGHSAN